MSGALYSTVTGLEPRYLLRAAQAVSGGDAPMAADGIASIDRNVVKDPEAKLDVGDIAVFVFAPTSQVYKATVTFVRNSLGHFLEFRFTQERASI